LGLGMGQIQKSMRSAHCTASERAMFGSSLSVYLSSSILLWVSRPCYTYLCPYRSQFQLCRWTPGRRCEVYVCVCGRGCSRKGSMFGASGFSGVDAGGSWVTINPPMLTAVSRLKTRVPGVTTLETSLCEPCKHSD